MIMFRSWWKKIREHPYVTGLVLLVLIILFIYLAYSLGLDWTGFISGTNQITITSTSKGNYTATISQPSKSLWDWLQLLIVPAILAIGGYLFSRALSRSQQAATDDNQREAALQVYLDKMSKLLLDKDKPLRKSKPEEDICKVARTLTLTVLEQVGGKRTRRVLQFLYEADLICKDSCIIELNGANLKDANLRDINLKGVNLKEAYLYGADLRGKDTDLSDACLRSAKLDNAKLINADLSKARLPKANLRGADLSEAYLCGADLRGATYNTETEQMTDAQGNPVTIEPTQLQGARYNKKTIKKKDAQGNTLTLKPTQWPQGLFDCKDAEQSETIA